ncbi:hypothetical protein OG21DRAFT_1161095 [Imleria badia]|nr:hypothetical protein OG21DRAFT_1161095 [Imleria badia]
MLMDAAQHYIFFPPLILGQILREYAVTGLHLSLSTPESGIIMTAGVSRPSQRGHECRALCVDGRWWTSVMHMSPVLHPACSASFAAVSPLSGIPMPSSTPRTAPLCPCQSETHEFRRQCTRNVSNSPRLVRNPSTGLPLAATGVLSIAFTTVTRELCSRASNRS